jgi:hypothetical protein
MRSARSILALRFTPVSVAGGVRKAVGGFLRYIQFRDQHMEPERDGGLDAYVRYVAHRDRTSPGGRVFGRDQADIGVDRRRLVEYVLRSTKGLEPKWVQGRDGKLEDRQRAVYQLVLSPEDWRGLDLRRLARAAMEQLALDAGPGGIGPWIAAEHRNTKHHHVHIVLAARREVQPGHFQTLLITRRRLQRMKEAIGRETDSQRGLALESERGRNLEPDQPRGAHGVSRVESRHRIRRHGTAHRRWHLRQPLSMPRMASSSRPRRGRLASATMSHLRSVALRYHHQMERELEEELDREGWLR